MFRENIDHVQPSLLDADYLMSERSRKRLEKSWAIPFYRDVFCRIDERRFEPLFSRTGAPNTPVNILMSLEIFKYMFSWSDDQLMDEYDFNYLVNYAVGNRQIGQRPMAEKTLYNFRSRCFQYLSDHPDEENPIFGQFLDLLEAYSKSAHVAMSEQRMDTTLFMSNMKKSGRLSLCFDVLELAVSAIPEEKRPEYLARIFDPEFRKEQLYKVKSTETDHRLKVLLDMCQQAKLLLEQEQGFMQMIEYKRLCRLLEEQTVAMPDGSHIVRANKDISPKSLQSAYDDEATFRRKSGEGHSGYVAAITETCGDDNPVQFITDIEVQPNTVSDVALLKDRRNLIADTGAEHLYVDGGFNSSKPTDSDDRMQIHYTNMSGTKPEKKIDASCFVFDDGKRILQCPAGNTPIRSNIGNGQTTAHFETEKCSSCPFYDQCPVKFQKKSMVVRLSLKSVRAAEIRKETEENATEYTSKRAGIEGTNSAMKRTGMAKMRVRGLLRCRVVAIYMATAQNTKRLLRYLDDRKKEVRKAMKNMKLSTAAHVAASA